MTLRLVIEHATHPQTRTEFLHQGGEVSIGRGAECDWQIEDPDMFISRKHCVVTVRDGACTVTDFSRGGVFLDGASTAMGTGNTARLDHGMRIRMGDIVLRADIIAAEAPKVSQPPGDRNSMAFKDDDFFVRKVDAPPPQKRPQSLPPEFEKGRMAETPPERVRERGALKPLFDDPFLMDPLTSPLPPPPPPLLPQRVVEVMSQPQDPTVQSGSAHIKDRTWRVRCSFPDWVSSTAVIAGREPCWRSLVWRAPLSASPENRA